MKGLLKIELVIAEVLPVFKQMDVLDSVNFGRFAPVGVNAFIVMYEKSIQGAQEFAHNSARRAHPRLVCGQPHFIPPPP